MKPSRRAGIILMMVAIFLLTFITRAYRPLSWPPEWLFRAQAFNAAIDSGNWADTYQSPHPGVTVMAFGGTAIRLYYRSVGTPFEQLFSWTFYPMLTDWGRRISLGVYGLAVLIAALMVVITLALRKLSNWPLALTAAALIIFEPFYLSSSRSFHIDGPYSTLMLASALLLLLSLQNGKRRNLLASGLLAGLAVLTKAPSLFLVPFTGLALWVHLTLTLRADWSAHAQGRMGWLAKETWRGLIVPLALWLVMAALPFALWPAMWVGPLDVLRGMFAGTSHYFMTPHENPRFFAGQIFFGRSPSPFYYPVNLAFNSTFITLTLSVLALGHYTLWPKRVELPLRPVTFWLMVAYIFFFTVQMMLGAKVSFRYILPIHIMQEVLAAAGLLGLMSMVRRAIGERRTWLPRVAPAILVVVGVGLQIAMAAAFAPMDYGAHRNYLLGGNQGALDWIELERQNEGITVIADYLNNHCGMLLVGVMHPLDHSLPQYFGGQTVRDMPPAAQYYLFNLVSMQRAISTELWLDAWLAYQDREPLLVVSYDGVPYMWLYTTHLAPQPDTITVDRGWMGFVWVAWGWTAALVTVTFWAWTRTKLVQGRLAS